VPGIRCLLADGFTDRDQPPQDGSDFPVRTVGEIDCAGSVFWQIGGEGPVPDSAGAALDQRQPHSGR
jgi:hypothetical protein